MKINLTLTDEEIQAVDNAVLETTTDLASVKMAEPVSELIKDGDVIDTGAIKIARMENQISIDIESKFVFWCLKFASKIGKICKFVYEMFKDLFEDLTDGYFKDEIEHYNVLEKKPTPAAKADVFAALQKMRDHIKAAGTNLDEDTRTWMISEFNEMQLFMLESETHYWPEVIELIDSLKEKLTNRAGDPDLWEELWTNIGNFILDHKDDE